jgi:hypothetical protein
MTGMALGSIMSIHLSFVLATIPVVVFAVADASKAPAAPPPIKPVVVMSEGIRAQRMDDETFSRRWQPLYAMPPSIEVRYVAREGAVAAPVSGQDHEPPSPSLSRHRRLSLTSKRVSLDICARHGMHKRYYTRRHWKSWRCRR